MTCFDTVVYTYDISGWTDRLTSVDNTPLTYDDVGNVLTYGNRSFTWSSGRNLASITDGTDTYSYTYDENGIRTSKTVNGTTTQYNTKDGVILSQSDGTTTMTFQYDTAGQPLGFTYNGVQYLYMVNVQGNVFGLANTDGTAFGQYDYDEWGNPTDSYTVDNATTTEVAAFNANPLRYRGYYYDSETGYYYLQSRYYDPSICRFINSDIPEIAQKNKNSNNINAFDLYAYCNNEPVNNIDPTGYELALSLLVIATIIVAVFATVGVSLLVSVIMANDAYKSTIYAIDKLHIDFDLSKKQIITLLVSFIAVAYPYAKKLNLSGVKAQVKAMSISIADARVKVKVKREKKSAYWIAYIANDCVYLGTKISRNKAVSRLRGGLHVFSTSKYNARNIALNAGGGKTPWGPEKHGASGFFWHYHLYKHKYGSHSFYL